MRRVSRSFLLSSELKDPAGPLFRPQTLSVSPCPGREVSSVHQPRGCICQQSRSFPLWMLGASTAGKLPYQNEFLWNISGEGAPWQGTWSQARPTAGMLPRKGTWPGNLLGEASPPWGSWLVEHHFSKTSSVLPMRLVHITCTGLNLNTRHHLLDGLLKQVSGSEAGPKYLHF